MSPARPASPSCGALPDSPLRSFKKLCTQCSNQDAFSSEGLANGHFLRLSNEKRKAGVSPVTYCIASRIWVSGSRII